LVPILFLQGSVADAVFEGEPPLGISATSLGNLLGLLGDADSKVTRHFANDEAARIVICRGTQHKEVPMRLAGTSEAKTHVAPHPCWPAREVWFVSGLLQRISQKFLKALPLRQWTTKGIEHKPTRSIDRRPHGCENLLDQRIQGLRNLLKPAVSCVSRFVLVKATNFDRYPPSN
jgi:hypothetical protein